jgi:hypothetical protein
MSGGQVAARVLCKRTEQALGVGVVGEEFDNVTAFQRNQGVAHFAPAVIEFSQRRCRCAADRKLAIVAGIVSERVELDSEFLFLLSCELVALLQRAFTPAESACTRRSRTACRSSFVTASYRAVAESMFAISSFLSLRFSSMLSFRTSVAFAFRSSIGDFP